MDSKTIERGCNNSSQVTQGGTGGKPRRKLNLSCVLLNGASMLDLQFRWDSIVAILKNRYGNDFSQYQFKILLAIDKLCNEYGEVSIGDYQLISSGSYRGMNKQDVQRSLLILHELGMTEEFGVSRTGLYSKYRMSSKGERIVAWAASEYEHPNEILRYKSKAFKQSA